MSRVIFHLTDAQAGALVRIADGGRIAAFESRGGKLNLLKALRERGFLVGWTLTALGKEAAAVARELIKASHTGDRKDFLVGICPKSGEECRSFACLNADGQLQCQAQTAAEGAR